MRSRWADYRNLIEIHLPREDVVDLDLQANRAATNSWGLFSLSPMMYFLTIFMAPNCVFASIRVNLSIVPYVIIFY